MAMKSTAAWGTLSQNIQRQLSASMIAPPYAGPSMAPASAAATTSPMARPRLREGKAVLASAIPMGTVAPPPMAWTTRAATIHSRLGDTATKMVPALKITSDAW